MKNIKKLLLISLSASLISVNAHAADNALKGIKLGFGYDMGFGVAGSIMDFNAFIGNDGFSVDYLFMKQPLNVNVQGSMDWYLGGGGYRDWNDDDNGVRVPVGVEWTFADNVDAYGQISPKLRVNRDAEFGLSAAIGIRYEF